jgi:hypothetical protein
MVRRSFLAVLAIGIIGCSAQDEPQPTPSAQVAASRDSARPDGRALVASALAAHGEVALHRLKAGHVSLITRGFVAPGYEDAITTVSTFQFPDRLRESVDHATTTLKAVRRLYVRSGDRAWEREGDGPWSATTTLRPIEALYPLQLITELRELRDKGFSLDRGEDELYGGRTLAVVHISRGAGSLASVAFDAETKLVAKVTTITPNPKSGRTGVSETRYSDYRSYAGLMLPTTMVCHLDGEKFVENTLQEFRVLDDVDAGEFVPGKLQ